MRFLDVRGNERNNNDLVIPQEWHFVEGEAVLAPNSTMGICQLYAVCSGRDQYSRWSSVV